MTIPQEQFDDLLSCAALAALFYYPEIELVTERMRRVDLLTSRDVAAAVRATKTVVRREERQQQFDQLLKTVVAQV
jgi:hypothetical protein